MRPYFEKMAPIGRPLSESQKKAALENIAQILGIQHLGHVHFSPKNSLAAVALEQVQEYLSGNRQQFTVPINWQLFTQFRTIVYQAVIAIPYGQTRAYSQIAAQIGRPKAARAVGGANASNPIPIIIPCHRLIGADGSLRGYGGVGGIQTDVPHHLKEIALRYGRTIENEMIYENKIG